MTSPASRLRLLSGSDRLKAAGTFAFAALCIWASAWAPWFPLWLAALWAVLGAVLVWRPAKHHLGVLCVAFVVAPVCMSVLGFPAEPSISGLPSQAAAVLLATAVLRGGSLPLALPAALLLLGVVEGVKQAAIASAMPTTLVGASAIFLYFGAAAGLARGVRASRVVGIALVFGAVCVLSRFVVARIALPGATPAQVAQVSERFGVSAGPLSKRARFRTEVDALTLALERLRRAPTSDALAAPISAAFGVNVPLSVGWRPQGDQLSDPLRETTAWALEARGRRSEALRMLKKAPLTPALAYTYSLIARLDGDETGALRAWQDAVAPEDGVVLGAGLTLGWEFLSAGEQEIEFVVIEPVDALVFELRGSAFEGLPEVWVQLDEQFSGRHLLSEEEESWIWRRPLGVGPHRLRVGFTQDAVGEGGDRNLWVDAVRPAAESDTETSSAR